MLNCIDIETKGKIVKGQILDIFEEIYHHSQKGTFVTCGELEVVFGIRGSAVQKYTEELKEMGFLFECEDGYKLLPAGISYAKSKWV